MPNAVEEGLATQAVVVDLVAVEDLAAVVEGAGRELPSRSLVAVVLEGSLTSQEVEVEGAGPGNQCQPRDSWTPYRVGRIGETITNSKRWWRWRWRLTAMINQFRKKPLEIRTYWGRRRLAA